MITISLCMIVKNEESILARCLDSIADLMDEIIIVDTGSTDNTREVAAKYTTKIYDFEWNGNFADARNYSFSKASAQYIYCADADEVIDAENHNRFLLLKKGLLPEIDIVQMHYCNQLQYNTIYNYDNEYRPKLYKRVRSFTWINPIHETVQLSPVIYDSDIEIIHRPTSLHASRDLQAFEKMFADHIPMNDKLHTLYAKELMISGQKTDFIHAIPVFESSICDPEKNTDTRLEAYCILARAYRMKGDIPSFFKYTTKAVTSEGDGCAEICQELGLYYAGIGDYSEAVIWFEAAYEGAPCILNLQTSTQALKNLMDCYEKLGQDELAKSCRQKLQDLA